MDRQGQGAYIPQELLKELSKASNRLLIDCGDSGRGVSGGHHPENLAAADCRGDDDEAAYYAVFNRPVQYLFA